MKNWTTDEIEYVRLHYQEQTCREIATCLHRTKKSVEHKIQHLKANNFKLTKFRNILLNSEMTEYMYTNYHQIPIKNIATKFNCSVNTIIRYARKLNIPFIPKSTDKYLDQIKPLLGISGVYQITNQTNNKKYIGYSCNIGRRFKEHLKFLFYNKHDNKQWQEDYNSGHLFIIELLYNNIDTNILAQKEQEYISNLPKEYRYNKVLENIIYDNISIKSIQKFWSKVVKNQDCWLWNGKLDKDGYGKFSYWDSNKKKTMGRSAHKFSYIIHKGQVPNGLKVCHKCKNKHCINPKHLFIGSDKINADDREKRNGGRKTKFNYNQILQLKNSGKTNVEIAKEINCSAGHITYILQHKVKSCQPIF